MVQNTGWLSEAPALVPYGRSTSHPALLCSLATRHAANQAAAVAAARQSQAESASDLEAGTAGRSEDGGEAGSERSVRLRRTSTQYLGETLGSTVSGSLQRIGIGLLEVSTAGRPPC